jgi:SAM-dependent methyltransferase
VSSRWSEYVELTRDSPPRDQTVRAAALVQRKGRAIDIGAGALNETRFLLEAGFAEVVAIDLEPLDERAAAGLPLDRFTYVRTAFESFDFPPGAFDLVNAQYSLPFIRPTQFNRVFGAIRRSLAPAGIFAGQLFGDRDEWAGDPHTTFRSRIAAMSLFDSLEVIEFDEEEVDDETADRVLKHWHVFHVIARKA